MSAGSARRIADELERRGLATPARLLVDAHRPLAPLIADLGAALGPVLGAALGSRSDDLRAVADDPDGLGHLLDELDNRPPRGARAIPR